MQWRSKFPFWTAALVFATAVLGSACSYTFDDSISPLPLDGAPIPPTVYPKLNPDGVPISDVSILRGADNAYWAVMMEAPMLPDVAMLPTGARLPDRARLLRLDGSVVVEMLEANQILVDAERLYLLDSPDKNAPTRLSLRRPGDGGAGLTLDMPAGGSIILSAPRGEAFIYLLSSTNMRAYLIVRSDGSFQRQLPLPEGVLVDRLFDHFKMNFDPKGEMLITRDLDGSLVAHATREERDLNLGQAEPGALYSITAGALIVCGQKGLRRVPLDGSKEIPLDGAACQPEVFGLVGSDVLYKRAGALFIVPALGGPPREVVAPPADQEIGQVLAVGPKKEIVYSLDPTSSFGSGIGDGWLAGQKYINRGRLVSFSQYTSRLRWLENAARSDGTGDLMSARIADGEPLLLARNVRQYSEVAPGKVLCISNAGARGTYNRLILIDEGAKVAHWVVEGARQYRRIPNTQDALVQIVTGQTGYDIRRVPLPL